jgi:hypothetical protein
MADLTNRLPPAIAALAMFAVERSNVVMFVAGFLFDVLTIQRIDALTDLGIQLIYLAGLTALLVLQHREALGLWTPGRFLRRVWPHNVDALHFLYGGLLSAYVVLYFRSSAGLRPLVFFALLVGLMFVNEMPQVRRAGHRLRLGLYAFCVLSFLNYFVPILVGRMGSWVFLISLLLAAGLVWFVADRLAAQGADRAPSRGRLFAPAGGVLAVIGLLYLLKLVPPVPLSVQFQGIYHGVARQGDGYVLTYERPPAWAFWRQDSRPFQRRPEDRIYYFVRVYAPAAFTHRIFTRWERQDAATGEWQTSDRIAVSTIVGGRREGYRTYAEKANVSAGRWRVTAETEDGRAIATLTFQVENDARDTERRWAIRAS